VSLLIGFDFDFSNEFKHRHDMLTNVPMDIVVGTELIFSSGIVPAPTAIHCVNYSSKYLKLLGWALAFSIKFG
jgi:hypothetical protein